MSLPNAFTKDIARRLELISHERVARDVCRP